MYTDIVRSVSEEFKVPVLDYFELWTSKNLKDLLAEDGLHANPKGHQLLFEQLRDFMGSEFS